MCAPIAPRRLPRLCSDADTRRRVGPTEYVSNRAHLQFKLGHGERKWGRLMRIITDFLPALHPFRAILFPCFSGGDRPTTCGLGHSRFGLLAPPFFLTGPQLVKARVWLRFCSRINIPYLVNTNKDDES
jgi:hypothetical protein